MNTIDSSPMNLPISSGQPMTRPVAPVSDISREFGDAGKQQSSNYIHRGELLEAVANERLYRPLYNLPINLQQQRAVIAYNKVAHEQHATGRILDGFI